MTKTTGKRTRKKSEVEDIAEDIALTVVQPKKVKPKVEKKVEEVIPEELVDIAYVKKADKDEVVEVAYAQDKVPKKVKVKAVQSCKGVFGKLHYEIKAGEVYELPSSLVFFLKNLGRVI